jgi:phosphatidylinositol-bisphosphatase
MVGICLIIFINKSKKDTLKTIQKDTVKTGMGGSFGNKGAVIIRINIYDTSICFACAHLAAGETKIKERFDDI